MIVEKETVLDYPQRDGSTKRQHLESIAKQSGKKPLELELPELDPSMLRIKNIFVQLSLMREYVNNHPKMLSDRNIYYWCKLHNEELSEWDLLTLKKLDISQINSLVTCAKEQS